MPNAPRATTGRCGENILIPILYQVLRIITWCPQRVPVQGFGNKIKESRCCSNRFCSSSFFTDWFTETRVKSFLSYSVSNYRLMMCPSDLMTLVNAASSCMTSSTSFPSTSKPNGMQDDSNTRSSSFSKSGSANNVAIAKAAPSPVAGNLREQKAGFVETLMNLLDDETKPSKIIEWMPDGKAFTIINHKRFSAEEMPKIFGIRNMSSFVRKLTRFGFTRRFDKETMNSDIFAHQDFVRGELARARSIKSAPSCKATKASAASLAVARAKTVLAASLPSSSSSRPLSHNSVPQSNTTSASVKPPPLPRWVRSQKGVGQPLQMVGGMDDSVRKKITSLCLMRSASRQVAQRTPQSLEITSSCLKEDPLIALLREREVLLQGADASAIALFRLLQEQERTRSRSLRRCAYTAATIAMATPSSLTSSQPYLPSLLSIDPRLYVAQVLSSQAAASTTPTFSWWQQKQQQTRHHHLFPFERNMY